MKILLNLREIKVEISSQHFSPTKILIFLHYTMADSSRESGKRSSAFFLNDWSTQAQITDSVDRTCYTGGFKTSVQKLNRT